MDPTPQPPARWTWWLHYALYLILVGYVVGVVIVPALREETFGYTYDPDSDSYRFRDFAGILVMAKALWSGKAGYDLDSHLAVTRAWTGRDMAAAMPFPYAPTMLYLLGPFCPLPLAWAFAAWSVFNLAVVGYLLSRPDCPRVLGPIVFLTPTAVSCFTLGQSALLAAAALTYLGRATFRRPTERGTNVWVMALVLWALTARPQLAITAGAALLALRHWRPVLIAVALTLVTTAALTPLLGTRWVGDYFTLVSHYDTTTAPPAFAWALVPSHMNNLRALLTMECGVRDDWSSKISVGVWLTSLAVVLATAWLRRVPAAVVWGSCILLQLLLCPHVNTYELVLLYPVLVFLPHVAQEPSTFRTRIVWFIPLLLCLPPVGPLGIRPSLLFFGLLSFAGVFGWLSVGVVRRGLR